MDKRFNALAREVIKLVVTEDAFGLAERKLGLKLNTRWQFRTDDAKLTGFKDWLKGEVDKGILSVDSNTGEPWTSLYVHSAHKQGVVRSFLDANPRKYGTTLGFYDGTREEFLRTAFAQPEMTSKLRILATRTFEELKGITEKMGASMNRVLADSLARGDSPRDAARSLTKEVGLSRKRARTVARTEIIHAHSEGQLDGMEHLGIEDVGVMVEWITAEGACPLCSAMRGVVLKVKEARGLIPRHPNCKCAFTPANVGEDPKGQKRSADAIKKAILKSVKAEKPKSKTPKKDSRWSGADRRIAKKRKPT